MRLLILAAVITLAYGHTACPPLWTAFKTNCFRFFPDQLRWEDASTTCGQFAPCNAAALGQLAKIGDAQDNAFLSMYINSFVEGPPMTIDSWLGGGDTTTEGLFTWGDGSAIQYVNWDFGPPRQPDNGAASGGQPENCIMFSGEKSTWFDARCDMMMPYVCMMPAEQERPFFPRIPQNPGAGGQPGGNPNNPNVPYNPNNPNTPINPNNPNNPNVPYNPNNPRGPGNPNTPNNPNNPRGPRV